MKRVIVCALIALLISPAVSHAAVIAPLASFGGGDGWLAPGEGGYTFLGVANNERGIAYGNGHVYLVSRAGGNNVRILDSLTAADLGGLNVTGISGGTFAVNMAGTSSDGSIYVANLTTAVSATAPYKVYKWATEAAVPTTVINSSTILAGSRLGDDMAMIDTGGTTLIGAGFNSTPAIAGNNGYAIADLTPGTVNAVSFVGTPPNAGDFRLGITFLDASHVLGTATGGSYRDSSFSGTNGTLVGTASLSAANPTNGSTERLLAVTIIAGSPILAAQSTTDAHVSIYDISNPLTPVFLGSANNTSGVLTANGNGVGELAWGPAVGNTATLYAMSTNQGIQAFLVTVPEPVMLAPLGICMLLLRCGKRNGKPLPPVR
jgi:hypothetical protein